MDDLMSTFALSGSDYKERARQRRRERDDKALSDVLAESVAADVGVLRLALAQIAVGEADQRVYEINCRCSTSGKGCNGHVPEAVKIARRALGLVALPDNTRVPNKPSASKKKKSGKKVSD